MGTLRALHVALSEWAGAEADVVDLATGDAILRYEVVSAGRPLFEATPGVWVAFRAKALVDHDDLAPFIDACIRGVGRVARAGQDVGRKR